MLSVLILVAKTKQFLSRTTISLQKETKDIHISLLSLSERHISRNSFFGPNQYITDAVDPWKFFRLKELVLNLIHKNMYWNHKKMEAQINQ